MSLLDGENKEKNSSTDDVLSKDEQQRSANAEECVLVANAVSTSSNVNKSIHNDIDDYVFTKPHKKKKVIQQSREFEYAVDGDYPIVRSTNESCKTKRSGSGHRKHHHKRKKMKKWKKIVLSVACTLMALIVLAVSSIIMLIYNGSQQMLNIDYSISAPDGVTVQNKGQYVVYNGKTYEFNKNITSLLCIGVDKTNIEDTRGNGINGQADVLLLMAIDTATGKTTIVNISRDTMTDVATYSAGGAYIDTRTEQICLSYAYGDGKETSCENTVTSVQRLFYNLPINSYFSLDLEGISAINDAVGGVDVVSPETIGTFTEGESYHLVGKEAESFVRTRDIEKLESNSLRMQRQQTYINSFMNTVIAQTKKDFTTPIDLFNTSSEYSCTNLNPSKICYLAQNIVSNGGMSIGMESVPGTIKQGEVYAEYYVNEKNFYEMFLKVFYKEI